MPHPSTAYGRVEVAAVIDAVNHVAEHLTETQSDRLICMIRARLAEAAPEVAWIVDRRGFLDVCQGTRQGYDETAEVRPGLIEEVKKELRKDLRNQVWDELRIELSGEVEEEIRAELEQP